MAGNSNRRRNLVRATKLMSVVALALVLTPFVASLFSPEDRQPARQASAGLVVELDGLAPGEVHRLAWKGKPVWIYRRTEADIEGILLLSAELADPDSLNSQQPSRMHSQLRSEKPDYFVFIPLETSRNCRVHLVSAREPDAADGLPWYGGFAEACHGARFDLAGRVYAATGNGQQKNLAVPPHRFIGDTQLELLH